MNRRLRNRLLAAIALALLVGGGTLAAVTAAQNSAKRPHARATTLAVAAAYLGVSEAQLRKDVRSGESLAQVAQSTGHSPQGLIGAIVAAQKSRLEAQLAELDSRVSAQVTRSRAARRAFGAPGLRGGAPRSPLSVAASYLGLSTAQLHVKLRSGETLTQIADSTPGRSREGLIAAVLAKRRALIEARVAEGALTPARAQKWLARLQARLGARVDRVFKPLPVGAKAQARRARARALRAKARARAAARAHG